MVPSTRQRVRRTDSDFVGSDSALHVTFKYPYATALSATKARPSSNSRRSQ